MKILYVSEGDRDEPLRAIITRIGSEVTGGKFPLYPDKVDRFYIRPTRGFGWVERVLRDLNRFLDGVSRTSDIDLDAVEYDFIVASIDHNAPNKDSVRRLARRIRCVLGIARWEFEAWILGDRLSLRTFLNIGVQQENGCAFGPNYRPEQDQAPKRILDCLCQESSWEKPWDSNLSAMLANEWEQTLDIEELSSTCARGFRPFANQLAARMARELNVLNFQQW